MRTIDQLPPYDPFTPEFDADPVAVYAAARREGTLVRHPFGVAALGYDEVQSVLRDRRFVNPPGLALQLFGISDGPIWDRVTSSLLDLDGAEHTRLRRLVAQSFTPRTADRLRGLMRDVMAELLGGSGEELDVVRLVETYPIAVICGLLDVPRRDWPFLSRAVDDVFRLFRPTVVEDQAIIVGAMDAMDGYVDRLVAHRRSDGLTGEDLVTALVRAEQDGDRLTLDEVRMLVSTVLAAGTDTTRNQLAAAIDTFLDHPDQWALLRERPELVGGAVDEVLRYNPISQGLYRVATEDLILGDVALPAGTLVAVMTAAANHDPAAFPEPERFDITRRGPAPQLSFGGGIHVCLGVHLAKAELAEALTQMSRRWETIERTGPAPAKPRQGVGGPVTLPIAVNETARRRREGAPHERAYRTVVVGTDGSPTAAIATARAAEVARAHGATLQLVSAVPALTGALATAGSAIAAASGVGLPVPHDIAEHAGELRRHRIAQLERAARAWRCEGLDVGVHVREGDAATVVLQLASDLGADLVVVGDRGLGGWRALLGSVPNRVAHRALLDVLVVHTA